MVIICAVFVRHMTSLDLSAAVIMRNEVKIYPADTAFSWCIRTRDYWTCQRCLKVYSPPTQALHCMHFMGRGKWSTRFEPDNAAAGCYGCHRFLDTHPTEKAVFFRQWLGDGRYDQIVLLSNQQSEGIKKELKDIAKHYRKELERIRRLQARGNAGRIEIVGWI